MARVAAAVDRDEAIALLAMQDPEAEPLLGPLPEAERMAEAHLALPSGGLLSGGYIAVPLLLAMRRTAVVGRTLRALRASRSLHLVYRAVSANRSRLGRLVPDGPGPRRFP